MSTTSGWSCTNEDCDNRVYDPEESKRIIKLFATI